jgi:iron complex outermembrane receptor protein
LFSGDVQGGGGNIPPVVADRRVNALFAELNIPIVKSLELQLQARHDRYSDFGNSTNPKVALRWNPSKEFLLRTSYNTGFRAPSLPDLFLPKFKGNTANSFDDPIRCPTTVNPATGKKAGVPIGAFVDEGLECNAQFINQQGGNRTLIPEKSKQFTLGLVIEPTANISAAFDYFAIKRENTITALGDTTLFDNYTKYEATKFHRFERNALGNCSNEDPANPLTPAGTLCAIDFIDQFQENLGITNTRGIDISIQTRFPTSLGQFTIGLDGTKVLKYEYQREPERNSPFFDNNGIWTSDLGGAIAKWKHSLAFGFKRDYWTATVINNYVAGHVDDGGTRDVGSFRTWDVQSAWNGGVKNMQLTFGIRNIMNMAPPASVQGSTFQVGYDPTDTDPHGRTFYGNIKYKF